MGVPVLHGVPGESARIVEAERVGVVFESEDDEGLRAALEELRSNDARRREYACNGPIAVKHYDRSVLARDMLKALELTANGASWTRSASKGA